MKKIYSLSLYRATTTNSSTTQVESWPFIQYIQSLLEGKDSDQKIETLNDNFSTFEKISFVSDDKFVENLRSMFWPNCKRFRKLSYPTSVKDQDQCIIIQQTQQNNINSTIVDSSNSNLPDVFAIIEADQNFYFLASYRGTTLQDLITYNPGVFSSNLKKSFITYQLSRMMASLHSRGVLHGGLMASNILVDENLWVQISGIEFGPNPIEFGNYQS